jgi:hypothetical protein
VRYEQFDTEQKFSDIEVFARSKATPSSGYRLGQFMETMASLQSSRWRRDARKAWLVLRQLQVITVIHMEVLGFPSVIDSKMKDLIPADLKYNCDIRMLDSLPLLMYRV